MASTSDAKVRNVGFTISFSSERKAYLKDPPQRNLKAFRPRDLSGIAGKKSAIVG
jgi:hypothetical protein